MNKYIARDPRTGQPIKVGKKKGKVKQQVLRKGPWSVLRPSQVMDLATGQVDSIQVRWQGKEKKLTKKDGIEGIAELPRQLTAPAHVALLEAFGSNHHDVRAAALRVMPTFATRKSDELFDWLSVLLDDDHENVQRAASQALIECAAYFPSGIESSLLNEVRHNDSRRREAGWKALEILSEHWPEVAADHIDGLLLEDENVLRQRAAKLIQRILNKSFAAAWDLVSWCLNDDDDQVRLSAAKTLPTLARHDNRMATLFAERTLTDANPEVRLAGIKAMTSLNRDSGRVKDLIIQGARSSDIRVRRASIDLLPRILGEDQLRILATDLLQHEKDAKLIASLSEMRYDAALEGSEDEKNAALSPALPIPELDRELSALKSYVPMDDLDESPSQPTSLTVEDELDDEDEDEQDEVRHD
jgi:predicted metal-dependent hydrolase